MKPLMSIGVPVFNEGAFLEKTLQSLLAQDYPNFEIVISDNASTDETERICREYAVRDSRIKYYRMERNQGITKNFRNLMYLTDAPYFMWAAGHDLWEPNFISECVRTLEADPLAVLAFGSSKWIDQNGEPFDKVWGWSDTRGMEPVARFFTVFWGNMNPVLGVFRLNALRNSRAMCREMAGADLILLTELCLQGYFVHAVDTSWCRREFRLGEDYRGRMKRYRSEQFGLTTSCFAKLFPIARLPLELALTVLQARISWQHKLLITVVLPFSMLGKYFSARKRKA